MLAPATASILGILVASGETYTVSPIMTSMACLFARRMVAQGLTIEVGQIKASKWAKSSCHFQPVPPASRPTFVRLVRVPPASCLFRPIA